MQISLPWLTLKTFDLGRGDVRPVRPALRLVYPSQDPKPAEPVVSNHRRDLVDFCPGLLREVLTGLRRPG